MSYHRGTRLDRLMFRVIKPENDQECWFWTGYITPSGYPMIGSTWAHRAMYEELVGPIPLGLVIDHLCRNRSCVNPLHLELVTQRENVHRGQGTASRSRCPQGHEYTPENTYVIKSPDYVRRKCRTCQLDGMRRQREKRRDEGGD